MTPNNFTVIGKVDVSVNTEENFIMFSTEGHTVDHGIAIMLPLQDNQLLNDLVNELLRIKNERQDNK